MVINKLLYDNKVQCWINKKRAARSCVGWEVLRKDLIRDC